MNILCYCYSTDEAFLNIWARMQKTSPELGLELHQSLDSFTARLRQPGGNVAVVLLYIADKKILSDLTVVRPLLNDMPVVILLKDHEQEMLKFSNELRPRVILYTSCKVEDICAVFQRCSGRYGNWGGA
ncbi:MAG: hypothetical protein ACYDH8_09890 [Syntrophales bacterium]